MIIMKSLQKLLVASALVCGVFTTSYVSAQETPNPETMASVMIVDYAGIMREASAMQDVKKQIRERQITYQQDIETRQQALREEEKQLAQQRTLLAADVHQEKQKQFQQKVAAFQKFAQGRSRVLDQALAESQATFQKALNDVIAGLAEERRATLVLHQAQVIIFANAMNASKEVFDRINKKVPTIKVEFKEGS
ncbi:OmpH family outer membrane protein [Thalassospira sp. CH_XMU1448-2]|jgi:Skp family chaperone for outer membrane proteins|uniref:OmpH family outer membrane protein n=1 Tax=Thalassospira sp. CH_XMU1448-2 TaxID=3107773 RepID=UPI0030095138